VLVARFETPTEGPSDLPTSWSTRREFVLVGSLQPFGGGTDDYFPANASLTENHGVLLVIDGDSVTVMTVTESAN
jgi:hypothetical protein